MWVLPTKVNKLKALLSASHEILVALNAARHGLPQRELKKILRVGMSDSGVFTSNNAFYNSIQRMKQNGLVSEVRVDTGLGFTVKSVVLTEEGSRKLNQLNDELEIAKKRIKFIEELQQGALA